MARRLSEEMLQDLYAWIDKIPLSRPKRHITRDFSDGVMAAEVVKYFFPKLVDLHNYIPANSAQQKLSNWNLLNRQDTRTQQDKITKSQLKSMDQSKRSQKVFSKLNFNVPEETVKKITLSTAGVIEPVLNALREKLERRLEHAAQYLPDLDYYDAWNLEKPHVETQSHHTEAKHPPQQAGDLKKDEKSKLKNSKRHQTGQFSTEMDPTFRLALQEKEQAVMALQETVEILQMKVDRLERLLHLKDMHIEDLTRHLDAYKAKGNMRR